MSSSGNVTVKEVIEVLPERNTEPHIMFLNNIDQRFGYFVRNIFFFGGSPGLDVLTERLRDGLSKVLVYYPCFAGRIRVNDKTKLEIDCNNQGALLGAASSPDLTVAGVTEADFDKLFLEPSDAIKTLQDLPLLNIQVTHLEKCGEYVITMCNHHIVTEATSAIYFLMNFASQCCGEDMVLVPTFDRTPLAARDPPQPKFEHHEFGAQGAADSRYTVSPESVLKAVSLRKKMAAFSSKQRKKYHLSLERLSAIKQAALRDHTLTKCSTFETLAALVWRAHVGAQPELRSEGMVKMRFVMDTRSIITPPLGLEFCGNAVYSPTLLAKKEELLSEAMSATVKRIQAGRESITEEYVRSGMDFLELHPDYWYHPQCDTIINAWPKAMGYSTGLDFGWGKPTGVEYPMHPDNKSVIFFPFSATGLEVSVCLEPHQFTEFEKEFHE